MKKWNKKGILALSTILAVVSLSACGDNNAVSGQANNADTQNLQNNQASNAGTQGAESLGHTEYEGLQTYAEFAGVEALPDNEDAKVITIAYGISPILSLTPLTPALPQVMILRC